MFQKKSTTDNKAESKDIYSLSDTLSKKTIQEEIRKQSIHTMKSDTDNLYLDNETPGEAAQEMGSGSSITENSPFAVKSETHKPDEAPLPEESDSLSKIIIFLIFFFIIILLLGTGYYFWSTRIKNSDQDAGAQLENSIASQTTSFSEKKANYLSLNLSDATSNPKKTLQEYATKVSKMETTAPIQFIITDNLNNPVPLPVFAQKIGLNFPPTVLAQLDNTFSLYIYKDNSQAHFGLALASKDGTTLKVALEQQEIGLFQALNPLFPENSITNAVTATFKSSTYKGYSVRYANLATTAGFSIDYAIIKDQLIIGTSQMTTRSIIDTLAEVPTQPTM